MIPGDSKNMVFHNFFSERYSQKQASNEIEGEIARATVKFKSGKVMRQQVELLTESLKKWPIENEYNTKWLTAIQ